MPRQVDRTATSLNVTCIVRDAAGDPVTGIAFDDVDLAVHYRRSTDAAYVAITLVAGTVGTWTSGGWIEIGDGEYQLGVPDAAIVAGDRTTIRITYGAAPKQYDAIDATAYDADTIADDVADAVIASFASSQLLLTQLGLFQSSSEINIRQGDDYLATKNTAWEKEITLAGFDFAAAGMTVRFGAGSTAGTPLITGTATLVDAAVGSVTLRLEFDRNDTKAIAAGSYHWDAEVVHSDGDVLTIDGGMLNLESSWTTLA